MSKKVFQGLINQMKDELDGTVGVIDDKGVIIACNDLKRVGVEEADRSVFEALSYSGGVTVHNGCTYKPLTAHGKTEYIVFTEGADEEARHIVGILTVALAGVKALYDEKYDKTNFVKNIILDNILPGDIFSKAKELHLENDINRAVYLIRFADHSDAVPFEIIQNMFPDKNKDYVIGLSETDVVLVKELKNNQQDAKSIDSIANSIVDTVQSEFFAKVTVGIGSVAANIKELAHSFKDAQVALEVGKVFDTEKNVINYESLGIARLIYQLPSTLCEMFLSEVFRRGSLESLDRETLMTIQAFFDNNLNVSETSRKLFVHRNTLVYRLEKIKKLTGLDLREFDHAITFKVALMVKKYVISKPTNF